jgi:hypothetical protein
MTASTRSNSPFDELSALHVPKILQDDLRQQDSASNRDWLVKHSGFAYKICVAVPHMVFKNAPKFLNAKGEEDKSKRAKWDRLNGSQLWQDLAIEDRKHGWAIANEIKLNPMFSYNLGQRARMEVFSTPHVRSVLRNEDGDITQYNVEYVLDNGEVGIESGLATPVNFPIAAPAAFHVESIRQKNHFGISVLTKCWSHIIFAEWVSYLTIYVDCYMKPMLFFPFPPNTPSSVKDEVKTQLEQLPLLKALTGEVATQGNTVFKPEWISAAMETKFQEHLQVELSMIAADAEMPQRFLVGDPKGALAASAEDGLSVQEYLESVFKLYEPFIRFWCTRNGILKEGEGITLKPDIEMRMSELDKKQLELIELQKIYFLKEIATINEMREKHDLPPLSKEEGGDTILSISNTSPMKIDVNGLNPNAPETKPEVGNPEKPAPRQLPQLQQ